MCFLYGRGVEKDENAAEALLTCLYDSVVSEKTTSNRVAAMEPIISRLAIHYINKEQVRCQFLFFAFSHPSQVKAESLLQVLCSPPFANGEAAFQLFQLKQERQEKENASFFLERAANLGHAQSMLLFARELQERETNEAEKKAIELYQRSWRDHTAVEAVRALGNIYLDGRPGVEADKRAG